MFISIKCIALQNLFFWMFKMAGNRNLIIIFSSHKFFHLQIKKRKELKKKRGYRLMTTVGVPVFDLNELSVRYNYLNWTISEMNNIKLNNLLEL